MANQNRFPNSQVRFRDTYEAGSITVRGIELQTDENGYVEGPPDLEKDIEAHGFVRVEKWFNALPSAKKVERAVADESLVPLLNRVEQEQVKKATQRKQQ